MTKSKKNLFLVVLMAVLSLSMAVFAGGITTVKANTSTDIVVGTNFKAGGVQVRTAEDGVTGLGFVTEIDKELVGTLGEGNFETGTIIMPAYYLDKGVELTLESVESFGLTSKCVIPNQGFNNRKAVEEEKTSNFYTFRGSLVEINPDNYTLDFASVGYITYNGETVYSAPTGEHLVANVDEVATAYAKTEYFAEDIEAEAPYVAQINAYTEAWDLKENEDGTVTLFDPENDWRRVSHGSAIRNYGSVVDATALNFGGDEYTGKAIKLGVAGPYQVDLKLSGADYYDDLVTSGKYPFITMYFAIEHKDASAFSGKLNTLLDTDVSGVFSMRANGLYLSKASTYNNWIKMTVPITKLAHNNYFIETSTVMNLCKFYSYDLPKTDPESNYVLYLGKIIAQNTFENYYEASFAYSGTISRGSSLAPISAATQEELEAISGYGTTYSGNATKTAYSYNNGPSITVPHDVWGKINNEEYPTHCGYNYVAVTLAVVSPAGLDISEMKASTAGASVKGIVHQGLGKVVYFDKEGTKDGYYPLNTWCTFVLPISSITSYTVGDQIRLMCMRDRNSSSESIWYVYVGEVKIYKDLPVELA